MDEKFVRTGLLLGEDGLLRLKMSRVIIFGVGGVGGYVAEALARSGVGHIALVDKDVVSVSNINRQIIATVATVGRAKTDVMAERIHEINPQAAVEVFHCFYLPETADAFDFSGYDYIVDAVDNVTAKIELVLRAGEAGTPIISSMGTGNKLNAAGFEVADIYETSVDPLARVVRRELKKRGVKSLKVVYSKEEPLKRFVSEENGRRGTPGSAAFVPGAAGLMIAGEVVKEIAAGAARIRAAARPGEAGNVPK